MKISYCLYAIGYRYIIRLNASCSNKMLLEQTPSDHSTIQLNNITRWELSDRNGPRPSTVATRWPPCERAFLVFGPDVAAPIVIPVSWISYRKQSTRFAANQFAVVALPKNLLIVPTENVNFSRVWLLTYSKLPVRNLELKLFPFLALILSINTGSINSFFIPLDIVVNAVFAIFLPSWFRVRLQYADYYRSSCSTFVRKRLSNSTLTPPSLSSWTGSLTLLSYIWIHWVCDAVSANRPRRPGWSLHVCHFNLGKALDRPQLPESKLLRASLASHAKEAGTTSNHTDSSVVCSAVCPAARTAHPTCLVSRK